MYSNSLHFHFTGIGGSGMSGIAEILLDYGFRVSGTDLNDSPTVEGLRAKGASVSIGHSAESIPNQADLVVRSSAIGLDNIEILEAQKRDIPVVRRAEVLAELMRLKFGVAVAGSHGKTTTTSMLGAILEEAKMDPTVIIGGIVKAHSSGARYGKSNFLVAESDESDRSFLLLKPTIAVITNIDTEHMSAYKSLRDLEESFEKFANSVPFYGVSVLCIDDPRVRDLANNYKKRKITYGVTPDADLRAEIIACKKNEIGYKVFYKNEFLIEVNLPVPGRHLMLNSLAAIGVAIEFKIDPEIIKKALNEFKGVKRRSEIIGTKSGITVIDDYAHHPTEIKATLKAINNGWRNEINRLLVIFQPHRYSRTRDSFADFIKSFENVDELFISDIYGVQEEVIPGISGESLVVAINSNNNVNANYIPTLDQINEDVLKNVKSGDLVLFLGAGSVSKYAHKFYESLS